MPDLEANARRFSGFSNLYDRVRPTPPDSVAELILAYAAMAGAGRVVDLGSGTGLSTRWAARWAEEVVGIEPSDDMRRHAASADPPANVSFRAGWAHDTGLADGTADAVVAVQALHWMDPEPTFAEVARILRPGGVFAAMDCDWPPRVGSWEAEVAWTRCRAQVRTFERRLAAGDTGDALFRPPDPDRDLALPEYFGRDAPRAGAHPGGVQSWSKDEHLGRMQASRAFRWCGEFAAASVEVGGAGRFVDLFRSQGEFQQLLAAGLDEEVLGVAGFQAVAEAALGDARRSFFFTYRVRLAVL